MVCRRANVSSRERNSAKEGVVLHFTAFETCCASRAVGSPLSTTNYSGVNSSVTLGDGLTQRGRYPGDGSHPVGSRGEDPIGDIVDEPPS